MTKISRERERTCIRAKGKNKFKKFRLTSTSKATIVDIAMTEKHGVKKKKISWPKNEGKMLGDEGLVSCLGCCYFSCCLISGKQRFMKKNQKSIQERRKGPKQLN